MKYSETLKEKRQAALASADALVAQAQVETRDLSKEEDAEIAKHLDEVRDLDDQISRHEELEARSAKAAEVRAENKIEQSVAVVKSEPRTYSPNADNSFLADAFRSQVLGDFDAQARITRHMNEERVERRDVNSGNFAGLVVPQFLTDLVAPLARAGRPTADIARKHSLPAAGLTISLSKITTGSAVAAQTEKASVQETDMDDTKLDISINTYAGQQNVSRQAIERGTNIDSLIMADLQNAYNTTLNTAVVAELLASAGQSVTYTDASPTVAEIYPKLLDAIQKVQTTFYAGPNVIIMHPRRLAWFMSALDSSNRPLVVPTPVAINPMGYGSGAVQYGNSGYSIAGLPVVTDATISTAQGSGTNQDTIYVGNAQELHLWEDSPMMLRFEQPQSQKLEITMIVYGYAAFTANRYPNAWAQINGTGLVTPTF